MEHKKMRRRGSFLVDAIVSMLIFTVGLLALALSLTFGARIIIDAGQNTIKEQKLANLPEEYLMDRNMRIDVTSSHSGTPISPINQKIEHNGEQIDVVTNIGDSSLLIGNSSLLITKFRYKLPIKRTSTFYVIERKP